MPIKPSTHSAIAFMTRVAVQQTTQPRDERLPLRGDRYANTNTAEFRRHVRLKGPACKFFATFPYGAAVAPQTEDALEDAASRWWDTPNAHWVPMALAPNPDDFDHLCWREVKRHGGGKPSEMAQWLVSAYLAARTTPSEASLPTFPEVPLTPRLSGEENVPPSVRAMGLCSLPRFMEPGLAGLDEHCRPYTEHMFDPDPDYVARLIAGIHYVDSPDFDITQFDCIKRLYAIVAHGTRMCIAPRAFVVSPVDLPDQAAQQAHMAQCANHSLCFDRVHQQLLIKSRQGQVSVHPFKTDVDPARQEAFLKRLATRPNDALKLEILANVFDGVTALLRDLATPHRVGIAATHGPGYSQAYFPDHRLPPDFAERSAPPEEDPHPLCTTWITTYRGTAAVVSTAFRSEAHMRAHYEFKLEKFGIRHLALFKSRMQTALIAGFVAEMVNAHPFTDGNNRVWTQIVLPHLLHRCGKSETILAVPNGFGAAVRYALNRAMVRKPDAPKPEDPKYNPHFHTDDYLPVSPGSDEYMVTMQPFALAIEDGQNYYQALCKLSPPSDGPITPDRWL